MKSIITILLVLSSVTILADVPLCPPIYKFTSYDSYLPEERYIASAGDVDNDGYPDIVIGEPVPRSSIDSTARGSVTVYSGKTGDTLWHFIETLRGSRFGFTVASAGDVNADGHSDIIVGAFGSLVTNDTGFAYIFSGFDGSELQVLNDFIWHSRFGSAVASAGDVNNDGYSDVIIGAKDAAVDNQKTGKAYIFSGQTWELLHTFVGESVGGLFGNSVAGLGDIDGDDHDDVIVGAWNHYADGFPGAGKVYVYSGQTGAELYSFEGHFNSTLGWSVASAGDVNNDGINDMIVGAPNHDSARSWVGSAHVYSGADGEKLYNFGGENNRDFFGTSVSTAGDFNNDGFDDLLISAPCYDYTTVQFEATDHGKVYIYSGKTGELLISMVGSEEYMRLGSNATCLGDVTNDGTPEYLMTVQDLENINRNKGYTYLYSFDDADGDSFIDLCDNCPDNFNPSQADFDADGIGDHCSACCGIYTSGYTGNTTCDPDGIRSMVSIDRLIDFVYLSNAPLCCEPSGNVDGSTDAIIDLSDITRLIDHIYISQLETAICQ